MILMAISVIAVVGSLAVLVMTVRQRRASRAADAALFRAVERTATTYERLDRALAQAVGSLSYPPVKDAFHQTGVSTRDRVADHLATWERTSQTPALSAPRIEAAVEMWLGIAETNAVQTRRLMEFRAVSAGDRRGLGRRRSPTGVSAGDPCSV